MEKVVYSDGNDYSNLEPNSPGLIADAKDGEFNGTCPMCGSENITVLDDKDICHDCGFIYT